MTDVDCNISLGYFRGPLHAVFRGVAQAGLEGAVLDLDGNSDRLFELAQDLSADHPDLAEANRKAHEPKRRFGPFAIYEGAYSIPITSEGLGRFLVLERELAEPELAIELTVRDEVGELIWAPDVGDNEIWVSKRLPAAAVSALRRELGDGLTFPWP